MIINNKLIFIHVPKTGGSSITHSLLSNVVGYETSGLIMNLPKSIKNKYGFHSDLAHGTALEIQKHIGEDKWNNYYKFAFVRNPWDRVVSSYYWKNRNAKNLPSFTEFVNQHFQYTQPLFLQTQMSFITSSDERIIVDDVFRFEEFKSALRTISFKTGIDVVSTIRKHKVSLGRKQYKEYYTNKTKDLITNIFKTDIEYFGYKF